MDYLEDNLEWDDAMGDGSSLSLTSNSLLQPTPINEEYAQLQVVKELPLLTEPLLAERQALCHVLRPLCQDANCRQHTPACVTGSSPADSDMESSSAQEQQIRIQEPAHPPPPGMAAAAADQEQQRIQPPYPPGMAAAATPDQYDPWKDRYNELLAYIEHHKDCYVPYHYDHNPRLSQWVKRQRHQYNLKVKGQYSNLTDERQMLLDALGFVWDSRASNWENRLEDLKEFRETHGHVRVSVKDRDHRPLAVWLKRQRHSARKFQAGDLYTGMTHRQLQQLLELGVNLNAHLAKST
jgi:hypothetical protein